MTRIRTHETKHNPPTTGVLRLRSFSFIRTMTVGSGIQPDLLTFPENPESARGLKLSLLPPVGSFTPP